MRLTRSELLQLCAAVAVATLIALLLRTERPLGRDIGDNRLAQTVRRDRSSPTDIRPDADLTLVVFTDYRCPACRTAHPAMKRAVERDGKVRIVYKDWPIFGEASERAARIAIASDLQNIYPDVHDQLMTGRVDGETALKTAVERSGGNWPRLLRDLVENRTRISAQLERNKEQAFGLGLGGTPGYLIGPILVRGALKQKEFARAFREARRSDRASPSYPK